MTTNRQCVICSKAFSPDDAGHFEDGRPAAERWTCSLVCQKRLEQRRAARDVSAQEAAEANRPDLGASPAEVARGKIAQLVRSTDVSAPASPAREGDPSELFGAASTLTALASELSDPEDRVIIGTLAQGFLDRALQGAEAVLPEEPDFDPGQEWEIPSESSPGVTYTVREQSGTWSCTCPAWVHGKGKPCKHIKGVARTRG